MILGVIFLIMNEYHKIDTVFKRVERDKIVDIASKLGLMVVPIILTGTLGLGIELVQNNSVQSYWGNFKAEGLVAKPRVELKARNGDRIITKIKVKDFVVPTVSTKSVL